MFDIIFMMMAPGSGDMIPCVPPAGISAPVLSAELVIAETPLGEPVMREATGGSAAAVDISQLGVNISTTNGSVANVSVNNSNTGGVENNLVTGNNGITAVFNNTGNGVVFSNTVQVNVFLGPGS